jgi:hypothetical protein
MLTKSILLLGLCVLAAGAEAQSGNCKQVDPSSRPDCAGAIVFFQDLQSAMQRDDRKAIAGMVHYPVRTNLQHKSVRVSSPQQLLAHFDEIFDKGVRCAILIATEKDVWGNWQGFTVSDGVVWFDEIIPANEKPDVSSADYWKKYPIKIKTINNDADRTCAARSPSGPPSN